MSSPPTDFYSTHSLTECCNTTLIFCLFPFLTVIRFLSCFGFFRVIRSSGPKSRFKPSPNPAKGFSMTATSQPGSAQYHQHPPNTTSPLDTSSPFDTTDVHRDEPQHPREAFKKHQLAIH